MMAGGDDGVVRTARARRPSIRPKSVTPPRAASPSHTGTWTLPPVRTPAPRAVRPRPVLMLIADETEGAVEVPARAEEAPPDVSPSWLARRQPGAIALAVASVLAAAFVTTAVVWTAIERRDAAEAALSSASTTTLSSAPAAISTSKPAPASASVPSLPVVDVNSLPPAPNRVASGAAR
jgi:hypothetical protein